MEKNIMIRFPSDPKFLRNKNLSDLLFGYFCLYSNKDDKGRYSLKKDIGRAILGLGITYPTYDKKMKALEEEKYVESKADQITVLYDNYKNSCLISKSTLEILLKSKLNNIIKVFVILNIFHETKDGNWFTYTSLLSQIGYSKYPSTRMNKNMQEILDYLQTNGLLKYTRDKKIGRNIVFRITEINKDISNVKEGRSFNWKWVSQVIDIEEIKKNNKGKYKKEDLMFILDNIDFPKEGIFTWKEKENTKFYNKAIDLALQYRLIKIERRGYNEYF